MSPAGPCPPEGSEEEGVGFQAPSAGKLRIWGVLLAELKLC